jgi:hypothetical protein
VFLILRRSSRIGNSTLASCCETSCDPNDRFTSINMVSMIAADSIDVVLMKRGRQSWKLGKSKLLKCPASPDAHFTTEPSSKDTIVPPVQPPSVLKSSASSSSSTSRPAAAGPVGLLTITIIASKDLSLPQGVPLPSSIEKAVKSGSGNFVGSLGGQSNRNRESIQRKQSWFLPYVVLEVRSGLYNFESCRRARSAV